ncbi:MAG: hypothetical protein ABUL67_01795 [Haliangium ochraceum]
MQHPVEPKTTEVNQAEATPAEASDNRTWPRGPIVRRWASVPPPHQPLVVVAVASFAWLLACLALQAVDGRTVLGVSTWVKPAKFAASISLTAATLAWLLRAVVLSPRATRRVVTVVAVAFALELLIISVQAARGVPSHFNNATRVDGLLFSVMGVGIVAATLALAAVAVRAFRQRFSDPVLGWGIRFGFVALLLGSAVGGVMPRPTAGQVEALRAGQPAPFVGAHAVGVPDGGPGLPVSGWAIEGGDLRVSHFLGLHGFQVLPMLGWIVSRRRRAGRDAAGRAAGLVAVAGFAYAGIIVVAFFQALRGQPLLRPDTATGAAAAVVLAAALIAAAGVLLATGARPVGAAWAGPWRASSPSAAPGTRAGSLAVGRHKSPAL